MVVFTCNHCGDTLQKPKVAKHYQFRCRKTPFVTCVDCLKDFREEEYVAHTKCISEAQRYGGKDYVPKPGANKGERKQQEWICVVSNLLNGAVDLSNAEKNFLGILSKYENVPRKKAKFLNFVKNAIGNRVNMTVVENVWSKMETSHKENQQTAPQPQRSGNTSETNSKADPNNSLSDDRQEDIIDNQNNENICKEHETVRHQNGNDEMSEANGDANETQTIAKKSKKRRLTESIETRKEPVAKSKKTSVSAETDTCNNDGESRKIAFDWRSTILDIMQNKNEISLKKLQKKTVSSYLHHSTKNVEHEKAVVKFHKKLKKVSEIVISDNRVKLAKQLESSCHTESEKTDR